MALTTWWDDDPAQRYWLEITDRDDLGANLHAPKLDGGGRSNWTYELLTCVQPGDVVLHWHKNLLDRPAIVAYSVASAPARDSHLAWRAHGTYGRLRGPGAPPAPSWLVPLQDYTPLSNPIDQQVLRPLEAQILSIRDRLLRTLDVETLYFPFAFSTKRPIRTTQGYLTKFPKELVALLPGLPSLSVTRKRVAAPAGHDEKPTASGSDEIPRSARASGYISDAVLRRAIENHAVLQATLHYQREWKVTNVGSTRSYDLQLKCGNLERHVEVKGSTRDATQVELTVNEVRHSRAALPCDLFVVDGIEYEADGSGGYSTFGGRARLWKDWSAAESALNPTRFRYDLPSTAPESPTR